MNMLVESASNAVTVNRMNSLIDGFIRAQDVKESSRDTYRKALKAFTDWLSDHSIINPIREDILAYKEFLQAQGLSSLTMSGYMVVVREFFEYLESSIGYQNVAKGIKGAKRSR